MKSLQTQKKEEMIDGNGHEVMTISQIAHMIKNIFTKKNVAAILTKHIQ